MMSFRVLRLSLLVIAFVWLIWRAWQYYIPGAPSDTPRVDVLSLPFEFVEGKESVADFSVDIDGKYEAYLILHRRIPVRELDSLMGHARSVVTKGDNNVVLPLALTIWQDDTLLVKKDSVDSQSYSDTPEYVGRLIDHFNAQRNRRYHVAILVNRTIPELSQTNPELSVTVVPWVIKQQIIDSKVRPAILETLFEVSVLVFLVILMINIVLEIRSRLTSGCT